MKKKGTAWQVILSGEGGQGLLVAGQILSLAGLLEGNNSLQTKSYGIAARGGFSETHIIISSQEIHYPGCENPDVILALTAAALKRFRESCFKEYLLLYDLGLPVAKEQALASPFAHNGSGLLASPEKGTARDNGRALATDFAWPSAGVTVIGYPFHQAALKLGDLRVINALFLGVLLKHAPLVGKESLILAMERLLPPKIYPVNLNAFKVGLS